MSYDVTLRMRRLLSRFAGPVDTFGEQALFYGESVRWIPNAITRYRKEVLRLVAEMTLGTGALLLIGGTVGVAAFLTLASGGVIAVQGYESLGNIGIEALTGFLSAFLNVRIVARSWPVSRWPPPSARAPRPSWVQCEWPRKSTPSNRWRCTRCPIWCRPG
ncbi:permease family protein [Mycobacterium xenopi 4042]|uniref:Permease family protein n=1 Tax=Mycobacterium xenopi 4042 TaxID=1299334 RepID=X7ZYH3_MYCXE|nr:permease family protein [Mycobacterium xenopi 4042]